MWLIICFLKKIKFTSLNALKPICNYNLSIVDVKMLIRKWIYFEAETFRKYCSLSFGPGFHADHPFVYFICEMNTNTIVFNGRVKQFQ